MEVSEIHQHRHISDRTTESKVPGNLKRGTLKKGEVFVTGVANAVRTRQTKTSTEESSHPTWQSLAQSREVTLGSQQPWVTQGQGVRQTNSLQEYEGELWTVLS